MKIAIRLGVVGLLMLCLTACPKLSTVSLLLDAIAAAAEAAAPIVQGTTGIDPTTGGEISEYLVQVGNGLSQTGAVVDSKTNLSASDVAQILGIWAKIAPDALPQTVPVQVRTAIAVVAAAVQAFLNTLQPGVTVRALAPIRTVPLTSGDRRGAKRIAKRGQALVATVRGAK